MRFMLMFRPDSSSDPNVPHCKQELPEMQRFMQGLAETGVLESAVGLMPDPKRTKVQYNGGKLRSLDGPFAETKELLAGVAIVRVKSRQEAVEIARQFVTIAAEGECEIRQIAELGAPASADADQAAEQTA